MKPVKALGGALVALLLLGAVPAEAQFGLKNFSGGAFNADGTPAREAGSHPYVVRSSFEVNTRVDPDLGVVPDEAVKTARFALPPGFTGSLTAIPRCATADFLAVEPTGYNHCSNTSAVGVVRLRLLSVNAKPVPEPVYNLTPPPGVAAKFGFIALNTPITVEVKVNDRQPFNILATAVHTPQTASFFGADLELLGTPADHSHDSLRGNCLDLLNIGPNGELLSEGICDTGADVIPWLTLPRSCTGPQITSYEAVSWQQPDAPPDQGSFTSPGMTGCSKLGFSPGITTKPTATSA